MIPIKQYSVIVTYSNSTIEFEINCTGFEITDDGTLIFYDKNMGANKGEMICVYSPGSWKTVTRRDLETQRKGGE